jgi:predicted secreted protein
MQDGSGFAYWEVFVIDLKTNTWVKGSPYRVVVQEDDAKLSAARDRARAAAAPALQELDITEPAVLLAANPGTEVVQTRERLGFDRWYASLGSRSGDTTQNEVRFEVSVETLGLPRPAACPEENGDAFGLRVMVKDLQMAISRPIHEDTSIPASRHCPRAYDVAAVIAMGGYPVTDRLVALIGVYGQGFEGSDHRFIAVPFTISD